MEPKPEQSTRAAWGDGRIAFLTYADHIHQRIAQGWPLKKIYRELESRLTGLSYQQFTYHIRRSVGKQQPNLTGDPPADKSAGLTPGRENDETRKTNGSASTRFQPGPRVPDPQQLY